MSPARSRDARRRAQRSLHSAAAKLPARVCDRLRFVAIRNDEQRAALERALPFASHPSSHLGHPGLTLKQCLKRFDNVMRKAGVTKKELGVTAHGLRHQFAQDFHVELTDVQA